MDVKTETEVQLLEELKALRRRLAELEAAEAELTLAMVSAQTVMKNCILEAIILSFIMIEIAGPIIK